MHSWSTGGHHLAFDPASIRQRSIGAGVWWPVLGFWVGVALWFLVDAIGTTTDHGLVIDPWEKGRGLAVVAFVLPAACSMALLAGLWCVVRPRRSVWAVAIGGLCLGCACAVSATRPLQLQSGIRGISSKDRLVEVPLAGASRRGEVCTRWVGTADVVRTDTRGGADCRGHAGQRLLTRAGDLSVPLAPPGRRGGSAPRVRIRHALRRGPEHGPVPITSIVRDGYWGWVDEMRGRAFAWARGHDARAMVVASTLGASATLAPARRAELRAVGLGHLIAVSGLHVGIVALVCFRCVVRLGRGRAWSVGVATLAGSVLIFGFVGLTGGAPPAVRAACMFLVGSIGTMVGRPTHRRFMPAWVLMAMVCARPRWLVDPAFQLSAAATWAIVTMPVDEGPGPDGVLTWATEGLASIRLSWRIAWATAAISWWWFGRAGWASIAVNVVAVPVFALVVLPFAAVGWVVMALCGEPGGVIAPAVWGARALLDGSAAASRLALQASLDPVWVFIVGVAVHAVALVWRMRRRGDERKGMAVRAWLPPGWAVASVGLAWWFGQTTPDDAHGVELPTLVVSERVRVRAAYFEHEGVRCLDLRGGIVLPWSDVLAHVGIEAGSIDAVLGEGPAVEQVRRDMGVFTTSAATARCVAVADTVEPRARTATSTCRRRWPDRPSVAMHRGDALACWTSQGWRGVQ